MADILHDVPIKVPIERVFDAVSTPEGLDVWWAERSLLGIVTMSSARLRIVRALEDHQPCHMDSFQASLERCG